MPAKILSIAMTLLGLLAVNGASARAEEQARPLTPLEIQDALIGNTFVYARPGDSAGERGVFIRLDGTGLAATPGQQEPHSVRWGTLSDGRLCIYDIGQNPWDGDCGLITMVANAISFAPAEDLPRPAKILENDAWRIDPSWDASQELSGKPAIQSLAGNTIVFPPAGGSGKGKLALYLLPDGTVRRATNDEPYFDHWTIQPDEKWFIHGDAEQLCIRGIASAKDTCAIVTIYEDLVTLHLQGNGRKLFGKLVGGDARHLSHASEMAAKSMARKIAGKSVLLKAADRQAETDSVIYFAPDGAGRTRHGDKKGEDIKWLIQLDGKLCVAPLRREYRDADCAAASITGDVLKLAAPGRPVIEARLTRGNMLKN